MEAMEKRKGSASGKNKRQLEAQKQFPDAGVKKKKRKVEEAERPNGEAKPEKGEEKAAAPLPPAKLKLLSASTQLQPQLLLPSALRGNSDARSPSIAPAPLA